MLDTWTADVIIYEKCVSINVCRMIGMCGLVDCGLADEAWRGGWERGDGGGAGGSIACGEQSLATPHLCRLPGRMLCMLAVVVGFVCLCDLSALVTTEGGLCASMFRCCACASPGGREGASFHLLMLCSQARLHKLMSRPV